MKSDMEHKDWLNETTALKKISTANPFTVPEGYFDNLTDRIAVYKNLYEFKNAALNGGFTVPENYFEDLESNIQSRVNIENASGLGFTIPDGYFDELSDKIQARIFIEESLAEKATPFSVPDGYFDELSDKIQSRVFIEESLGEPVEPFAVPEGYFAELSDKIQSRIFLDESLDKQVTPFAVPEGYFEGLSDKIQSRVFIEESLGEPVESLGVPAGYFDKLNAAILDKTVNAVKPRKKGIIRKLVTSTAFKYATAACVAVAVGGGILLNQNSSEKAHNKSFLHQELSSVPIDEIKDYLQVNVDAGDAQQTVATEGVAVDSVKLKNALQSDIDSVQ